MNNDNTGCPMLGFCYQGDGSITDCNLTDRDCPYLQLKSRLVGEKEELREFREIKQYMGELGYKIFFEALKKCQLEKEVKPE